MKLFKFFLIIIFVFVIVFIKRIEYKATQNKVSESIKIIDNSFKNIQTELNNYNK